MSDRVEIAALERLVRCCGADCGQCETYVLFMNGDVSGLVNRQTGCRCCWLPSDYQDGRVCPIAACCEGRGLLFCAECDQFGQCELAATFYAQPGYEALKKRMFDVVGNRERDS